MDLFLWRHAEAFEVREVEEDLDRALTPKGERQGGVWWLRVRTRDGQPQVLLHAVISPDLL